jgi:hypothetical protein
MSAKTSKKIEALRILTASLTAAVQAAAESGASNDEIKAELDKFSSLLDEE